jgi:WD40 repeat protein
MTSYKVFGVLISLLVLASLSPLAWGAASATSMVWSVQFSPDGKRLAVGRYQWVQLWDVQRREVIRTFEPHADAVRCLRFSSDGALLFAGGGLPAQSGEVKVWEVASGAIVHTFEIHGDTIEAMALTPDNSRLLTASMDEFIHVVSLASGKIEQTLTQHVDRVLAVAYREDGKYFATGGKDKTVKVWDAQTKNVLVNFDQNDEAVFSVAFAPEENIIISGSADNAVRSWRVIESQNDSGNIETRGALVRVYNGHEKTVYAVDCGMAGPEAVIVSGGADATVLVWDLRSGNRIAAFNQPTDEVYAVDLSSDGRLVAAGGRDGYARIWNISNQQMIAEFADR